MQIAIILVILIVIVIVMMNMIPFFVKKTNEGFGILYPHQYGINDPSGGNSAYSDLLMQNNWNYPGYLRSFPGYFDSLYIDMVDPTFKRDMYYNELAKTFPMDSSESQKPHMWKTSEYCVNERLRGQEDFPYETLATAIDKCTV